MKYVTCLLTILLLLPAIMTGEISGHASMIPLQQPQTEEEDPQCQLWIDSVMDRLSLKEQVGQLFIYTIAPIDSKKNVRKLKDAVEVYKVGGLLFSNGTFQNQAILTNEAQKMADVPLMITFDGEWGLAMRLKNTPTFPKNMVLGCIQDNNLITEYGAEMARQCRRMGVQVNFAPDADVNINPDNPVINARSFGENPRRVAEKVVAYGKGLEKGGVLSVSKHFPGHGDTDVDSHKSLPVLPFSRARLDSVELYPFRAAIRAGLSGIMVGHLRVPAIDPNSSLPSSLSRKVTYDLLQEELGFKGLVFTDALAMKGVSNNENVCLQALKAGNDMLLAPHTLESEIDAVLEAVKNGEITREDIEAKCRKVLTYKYKFGLKRKPYIQLSGLEQRLNTPYVADLITRLRLAAITVVKNADNKLPFLPDKEIKTALLEVGKPTVTDSLAYQLSQYTTLTRFQVRRNMSASEEKLLSDSLTAYPHLIVAVSADDLTPYQGFLNRTVFRSSPIYLFLTPPQAMIPLQPSVSRAAAVLLGHSAHNAVQVQIAKILFGEASADGRLSAAIKGLFNTGEGVSIGVDSPTHINPEEYGFSSPILLKIDSIALDGIRQGAYPGCQVVVLKDGRMIVDKSFGTFTGKGSTIVNANSIYDLASLSKTTATVLALMKLYDTGHFNLSDPISEYLPFLRGTNKKDIKISELLMHQSGLPSGCIFYIDAIDKDSYDGRLFKFRKPDARHTVYLGSSTWANPNFQYKKEYVSTTQSADYSLQICDNLWLNSSYISDIEQQIIDVPMKSKEYRYSDIGFVLLRFLVEKLAGMSMDDYLQLEFYGPMQLERTGYMPLRRFAKADIVPSSVDNFLRKTTLQGYVHDDTAAFQGGVSGNAGLFSTAKEVARICQMLLNGGELDGKRYLSAKTCELFTTDKSTISRRGLGFDMVDIHYSTNTSNGNGLAQVYGHTGFTGTCAWMDAGNGLVYVFLSNRTYPDATNMKLSELKIREKIENVVYEAMEK